MITTHNRWVALIWQTLLAILMMQMCRLLYFFYNQSFFPTVNAAQLLRLMQGGYIMDMVAIGYGFVLYYLLMVVGAFLPARIEQNKWYLGIRHAAYWVPFTTFIFLNVSDTGYYPFVLRRVNGDVFREFQGKSALSFYKDFLVEFWPLTLAFFVILAIGILGYRLIRFQRSEKREMPQWVNAICSLLLVVFLFFSMRGRWDFVGMPVSVAGLVPYMSDHAQFPLVSNAPVALTQDPISRIDFSFYDEEELHSIFTPYYQAAPLAEGDTLFGCMQGRNVMVILMESMSKEYIGFLNQEIKEYPSYTPFLDTLLPQTLYAQYGFSSGKRSVESFPSLFASLPSFGGTFNDGDWEMSNYQHFSSFDTGLPLALMHKGYDLKFYHGDDPGAMGFYDFLHKLGVDAEYTGDDYLRIHPDDKRARMGAWGIHDLPFEQAMAEDMDHLKEPFGALFFSLSNHYPFKLPSGFEGKFKEGTLPIHQTAQYADLALKEFFDKIKDKPWFKNTLFIITADHTNQSDHPAYNNLAGHAAAPIAFYDPQGKLKGEIKDYVVQHTDILPTLLYLLGIEEPVLSYGNNIFDTKAEHIALNYFQDQYIFFAKEITLTMTPNGDIKASAPAPYLQTEPDKAVMPSSEVQEHYTRLFKAIVQDYNHRVFKTSFSIKDVLPPTAKVE